VDVRDAQEYPIVVVNVVHRRVLHPGTYVDGPIVCR
jgi:hypothetical protein